MRISVVIPAYNAAKSIRNAINSCMQQSLLPHEIIVVNDASTDDTWKVASAYAGRVQLITLTANSGPATARNAGWDKATGDIVAFLDADDTWHADKLKILSEVFGANKQINFLGHPYTLQPFEPIEELPIATAKPYLSILLSNPFQSSCITARRSLYHRFINGMRYCEDHEFAMHVAYSKGCYMLPVKLTRLGRPQLTAGGASGNLWKMRMGELRAYSLQGRHVPLMILVVPLLWTFSIAKHCAKLLQLAIRKP